jgi:hypothetical protein
MGRFAPVALYDTGDFTDTLSVAGERVMDGEEDDFPAQDHFAEADVSRVTTLEDSETTTTENVPDVAVNEDKVSVRLPAEFPFVRLSVPDVSLTAQLAGVHAMVSGETLALLDDDVDD